MAFNPMQLLQLKERFAVFQREHPKIMPFLKTVRDRVDEGSLIELKVTTSEGKTMTAGLKVTASDMQTLRTLIK